MLTELVEEINIGLDQIEGEKGLPRYEIKVIEGEAPRSAVRLRVHPVVGAEAQDVARREPVFIIADDLAATSDLPEVFDGDSTAA